jgi:phosphocarrier protein HPr
LKECATKRLIVHISDDVTIVDISKATQKYDSEIYIHKDVNGTPHDINLKSFLGLINLRLKNGDEISIKAEGSDCEEALNEVVQFFS